MTVFVQALGVNQYRHPISSLLCCERDARAVAALFEEGFSFQAEYLEERKTEDVLDRIHALEPQLRPGDVYVFFFSGHGKALAQDQLLLLPGATTQTLAAVQGEAPGVLSLQGLKQRTGTQAWKGVQRLFILDACRSPLLDDKSGAAAVCDAEFLLRDMALKRQAQGEQYSPLTVLNSCELGATAAELPKQGHGLFTAALLHELRNRKGAHGVCVDAGFVAAVGQKMKDQARTAELPPSAQHQPALRGPDVVLPMPEPPRPASDEVEWMLVQTNPNAQRLEAFVRSFPSSPHVAEALNMLKTLAKAELPPPAAKVQPPVSGDVPVISSPPAPSGHPKPIATPDDLPTPPSPNPSKRKAWAAAAIVAVLGLGVWGLWESNKPMVYSFAAPIAASMVSQPSTTTIDAAEAEYVLAIWRQAGDSAEKAATLPALQTLATQGVPEAQGALGAAYY